MKIKSNIRDYQVVIENDFDFLKKQIIEQNTLYVIDNKVYKLYKALFSSIPKKNLFLLEATEENKTIDTALQICEIMTEFPGKKNSHIISVGGGITQDVTGFVANVLYRGIKWTFIPTTLLSACDSCIGGKTSLNYKKFKNLLGTFYPPNEIYICSRFFQTLSEKDFKSGMGEVVKFNIMCGKQGLDNIESNIENLLARDEASLNAFVLQCLHFKKKYIEEDEFDQNVRIKLNFAHTFGHAFESVSHYKIPHGTAVALGMIMADWISFQRGWLNKEMIQKSEHLLLQIIMFDLIEHFDFEKYIEAIRKDKKQIDENLTAVLICNDELDLSVVHDLQVKEIYNALDHLITRLSIHGVE